MATIAACAACAAIPAARVDAAERFQGTDGGAHVIVPAPPDAYSVVIFFSIDCHVLAVHDERVRRLAAAYAARNVRFWAVDSETGSTLDRDRAEAERRRYPFPILLDQDGALARSLGAIYAGYTVILDREGNIRYRGGIDSDRVRLRDDVTPYVSDALDDVLAGRAPRLVESKPLGCALRLH